MKLKIDLLDDWHIGSGQGKGAHLDAVLDRDSFGMPYIPGKMLKGLLRDAAERAASWGWPEIDPEWIGNIFGSSVDGVELPEQLGRDQIRSGRLRVANATLPSDLAQYFSSQKEMKNALTREFFSTAIQTQTGAAQQGSLRGIEIAIPMTLHAEIEIEAGSNADWSALEKLLQLLFAVGANKTRGFGRSAITLQR